jgi:hypothetical protein
MRPRRRTLKLEFFFHRVLRLITVPIAFLMGGNYREELHELDGLQGVAPGVDRWITVCRLMSNDSVRPGDSNASDIVVGKRSN